MEVFGKKIELRSHYCQFYDNEPTKIDRPYVNLYIRFKGCNANCKFCTFMDSAHKFNHSKFYEILKELKGKLHVRKLGFTGGEPTLNYDNFADILSKSYDILGDDTEYSVNSNGINFKRLYSDKKLMDIIDRLHLSRHHYDDDKNNKILGFNALSTEEIIKLQSNIKNPDFLQLSCNLIKGYIDNNERILEFLEFANNVNVHRVGLVSLMHVNRYSIDNYINNNLTVFNDLHKTKQWSNKGFCECSNYIYIPNELNEHCVKLYKKNTFNTSNINNTLTFNGRDLVYGFDDKNIIY